MIFKFHFYELNFSIFNGDLIRGLACTINVRVQFAEVLVWFGPEAEPLDSNAGLNGGV